MCKLRKLDTKRMRAKFRQQQAVRDHDSDMNRTVAMCMILQAVVAMQMCSRR